MREESQTEASAAEIKVQREDDSSFFFPVQQSINNNNILRSLFTAAIRTLMQTG